MPKNSLYILRKIKLNKPYKEEYLKDIRDFFLEAAKQNLNEQGFFEIDEEEPHPHKDGDKKFHYFSGLYIFYQKKDVEIVEPNTNDKPYNKAVKNAVKDRDRFIFGTYKENFFIAHKYNDIKNFEDRFKNNDISKSKKLKGELSNQLSDCKKIKSLFHSISKLKMITSIEVFKHERDKDEAKNFLKIVERKSNLESQQLFDKHFDSKTWKETSGYDKHLVEHLIDFSKEFVKWLEKENKDFNTNAAKKILQEFIKSNPGIYDKHLRRIEEVCIMAACCDSFHCEIRGLLEKGDYSKPILLSSRYIKNDETVFEIVSNKTKQGKGIFENIILPIIAKLDNDMI